MTSTNAALHGGDHGGGDHGGDHGGAVGTLLRRWRARRGLSQLALALETGLSQRHLSFVESGRSAPSRQAILTIAQALDVPLGERNRLLLAAGFAPAYAEEPLQDAQMDGVLRAVKRMLAQHEPFPALVMDRCWNVLMTNAAAPRFFGTYIDLEAWPRPRNMLHLMFDPRALRPFIANWAVASASLVERARREAVGGVPDAQTEALVAALRAYSTADVAAPDADADPAPPSPVVPLSFVKDGVTLHYFSIVSSIGAPTAVAAQELRVESLFPLDAATEAHHLALFGQA